MLEPVEQPQNFAGEGVAVIAVALVALVTAVEIALASKPFTMAYRAPTCAAPSTCIFRYTLKPMSVTETSMRPNNGIIKPNSTAAAPLVSTTARAKQVSV